MVIVGKTSFRVREPCPSFYLFGCLYYTIRASRFTRGGGDFEKAPATKATKAQNFPNSLSIYYFKISFYKNTVLSLQLADKWRNQAICCCTETAQNRHRTAQNCTELHRTPARRRNTPSPIPRIPPKVASKRATNPLPSHGLTAEYFSWSKPKETTRPIRPPSQSGKSVFFCGRNQPGASRSGAQRARKGRKGMVVASSPIGLAFHPSNLTASGSQSFAGT